MVPTDVGMAPGEVKKIRVEDRYFDQNQTHAIRDIYDALVELITNADDRYVHLANCGQFVNGKIEIEVERRRKGAPSLVRVRDFADGMTSNDMDEKLGQMGNRVSGMEVGLDVRGTNSRGAKDIAALGRVVFESIAEDEHFHKCEIRPPRDFVLYSPPQSVDQRIRKRLGIPEGSGTLVTVVVEPRHNVPQHRTLKKKLGALVPLRDILNCPERSIVLRDANDRTAESKIEPPKFDCSERLKVRISIPGYPKAEAKLFVSRAKSRTEEGRSRFRIGGILVKSRHAIHESTYFDPSLENDPHASWFVGKLVCPYIDDLWNEYDECFAKKLPYPPTNPYHVVDPFRREGMRRDHPFTQALFQEALKRFRPLVDEERKRHESERSKIESTHTRKRLNTLERAAAKFMEEHVDVKDVAREPDARETTSQFLEKGFNLSPPFAQIVVGHSRRFWLNIRQETFPEFSIGDTVSVRCFTDEISSSKIIIPLENHPTQNGILRATWSVKGERPCNATGLQACIGEIVADSLVEVWDSEMRQFEHIQQFQFEREKYSVKVGNVRNIRILAPYPSIVDAATDVKVQVSNNAFTFQGERVLVPSPQLGIAICKLRVSAKEADRVATMEASIGGHTSSATLNSVYPAGAPIKIQIVSEDFGNQRSSWKPHTNVLEIGAQHPSVRRYLGPAPDFVGQEEKHFRLLLAEIVAEAVCQRVLSKRLVEDPEEYQEADWDAYYADYTRLMTMFLPIAHETQLKDP